MAITYTTSDLCAQAAGMKTLSTNTFPSTTLVDSLRLQVYNLIQEVIGANTADINGVAAAIELNKVKSAIIQIRKNAINPEQAVDYTLELKQSEIDILDRIFNSGKSLSKSLVIGADW